MYQSEATCADMARAIQNACNERFKLLLAIQEEKKKSQKIESPGVRFLIILENLLGRF